MSIQAAGRQAPLAPAVLEMAAYLAPDAIPKSLFAVLIDDDAPRSRKRLGDAFGALARYSLAVVDDTTMGGHRLLQKTVRDAVAARADQTRARLALSAVDDGFPQREYAEMPSRWPLCEQLLTHRSPPSLRIPQLRLAGWSSCSIGCAGICTAPSMANAAWPQRKPRWHARSTISTPTIRCGSLAATTSPPR